MNCRCKQNNGHFPQQMPMNTQQGNPTQMNSPMYPMGEMQYQGQNGGHHWNRQMPHTMPQPNGNMGHWQDPNNNNNLTPMHHDGMQPSYSQQPVMNHGAQYPEMMQYPANNQGMHHGMPVDNNTVNGQSAPMQEMAYVPEEYDDDFD